MAFMNRARVFAKSVHDVCDCHHDNMSVKCRPLIPHFYIVKLGSIRVYLFFLFLFQNIDCGYLLEPPQQGGSNVYPQSMFCANMLKISNFFQLKFQILQLMI